MLVIIWNFYQYFMLKPWQQTEYNSKERIMLKSVCYLYDITFNTCNKTGHCAEIAEGTQTMSCMAER